MSRDRGRSAPDADQHASVEWRWLAGMVFIALFSVTTYTVGMLRAPGWDPFWVVVEFTASAAAAMACARTAVRCAGRRRRAWAWLAIGTAGWALGEAWWAVQELLFGRPVAMPSPADIGFLLLPVCAAAGLVVHPSAQAVRMSQRLRLLLDGTTIAVALVLVVWQFPATRTESDAGSLGELVALAYPLSDLALAAIAATVLTYATGRRQAHLIWLLAGLLALAGADFVFWSLADDGAFGVTSVADLLWTVGFAAIAVAATAERGGADGPPPADSPVRLWLPHALLAGSVAVVAGRWLGGARIDRPTVAMLVTVALLAYARQYVLLRENRRLVAQIHDGREELRHTGLNDPLTGLPNRAGLLDLIGAALQPCAADAEPAEVPSDRLDQHFAVVKVRPIHPQLLDNLHPTETDAVLCELAERIGGCLRPGDHLARVSEATFAALVVGDSDAAVGIAHKVMVAVDAPVATGRRWLHVGLVAGVAVLSSAEPETTALTAIQQAAMALHSVAGIPGGIGVFTPSMLREQVDHLERREAVVRALRDEVATDVDVLFEPIVEMSSGRLAGMAARAGLHDPMFDKISAGRLVALAREAGMAERVDETVLTTAIEQFGGWVTRWPDVCGRLWIGVCAETLAQIEFPQRLLHLLREAGLPPQALVLEPLDGLDGQTSSEVARGTLRLVREAGVGIVATDSTVRSGYSAVPEAVDLDADYFDVSPVLVHRCVADLRARRLVQATAEFATSRKAETAARQVFTVEQHEELLQAGCVLARGPLYGASLSRFGARDLLAAVANGTWRTPAGQVARRHRSSRAWQELRQVISGLPIAAFACGADGVLVLAEGALLDQLGVTADPSDQPIVDILRGDAPQESGDPIAEALQAALAGQRTVSTVQVRGQWLQVYLCPGLDDDGAVTGALGVAIDVTHRVQAEEALRTSEHRFKSIFTQAPVGMAIVSADARIQGANPALAEMLGHTPEELVGRSLPSLRHPDSDDGAAEQYEGIRSGRAASYRAERAYRHRDGSPVWTRITVGPLADPGIVIGIIEDLRPVKQLEVDLRHAQKLEAVGMLAAGIAHEINTPTQFVGDNLNFMADAFNKLTRAIAANQTLSRPIDDAAASELAQLASEIDLHWLLDEIPDAVQQSLDGVARVATIVGAMRNFGHPDGQEPTLVDIDAAIRDTTTVARNEYKYAADLHLELGGVPPVLGYPSQFHQVMLNLIVNAAHAIHDSFEGASGRGAIRIRSWSDDATVHVSVADDGCGMPAETRDRIFDPFFTTKAVGRGTGQGLTIVRNVVVDKHHGAIDVDSTPGQGSVFTVHLPRSAVSEDIPAPAVFTASSP